MRLVLFVLFFAGVTILSLPSVEASESRFVVNQKPETADIQMQYSRVTSDYDGGNSMTNLIGVEYARTFESGALLTVNAGFAHRDAKASMENGNNTFSSVQKTAVGFTDVESKLRFSQVEDPFAWYFGGVASISPGAARDLRLYRNSAYGLEETNNLSGYQTLGGMIGFESYVDKLAMGTELELRAYSDRSVSIGNTSETHNLKDRFIPTIKGFLEFPVTRAVQIGFNAALMRPDLQIDRMVFGGTDNHLSGKLFSEWKMDSETSALMEVGYGSRVLPFRENQSELNLGIRKAL